MASFTTWTIFLVLFSTFFVSKIADGNSAQLTEASPSHATGWDGNQGPSEVTPSASDGDDPITEAPASGGESTAESAVPPPLSPTQSCDVTSISSALTEKIETLEKKVESLVSQLSASLETKLSDLKSSVGTAPPPPSSNGGSSSAPSGSNTKVQQSYDACLEALKSNNVPEAITQWEIIEKETFGITQKATLLKDIFYVAYDPSKSAVLKFAQELINKSKKYLPSVFDVLKEATTLNSQNIFHLATAIKSELGVESTLFQKLPESVRSITAGKQIRLTYNCVSTLKKVEVHLKDDGFSYNREYWPVVAAQIYNLNHTKGGIWSFETNTNGNFYVKNHWFGEFLWIEPGHQNLRTVDPEKKRLNGTEIQVSLNADSTVNLHSVFYKDTTVVEGPPSRNSRDNSIPLKMDVNQNGIKFTVEPVINSR